MYKKGNWTGNDKFEGFCIDLLEAISKSLGFKYNLYEVPDKKFGAENTTTGEWNGLVREIIDKVNHKRNNRVKIGKKAKKEKT